MSSTDASSASSSVEEVGRPLGSRPGPLPWAQGSFFWPRSTRGTVWPRLGHERRPLSRPLSRLHISFSSPPDLRWANPNVPSSGTRDPLLRTSPPLLSLPTESPFKEAGTWNLTPLACLSTLSRELQNLESGISSALNSLILPENLESGTWEFDPHGTCSPLVSLLSWELGTWNLELRICPLVRSDSERMNWISHDGKLSRLELGAWLLDFASMLGSCFPFWGKFQVPDSKFPGSRPGNTQKVVFSRRPRSYGTWNLELGFCRFSDQVPDPSWPNRRF